MGVRPAADYAYFAPAFLALAHRGGVTAEAPAHVENSLRSFHQAWARGYRYLETDVHTTADGVLIAFHDDRLDRVTNAAGIIADLPWAEVSQARIGGLEPIPQLSDLFEALPKAHFNIDIKAAGALEPLVTAIQRHQAASRVCVGSFSTRRMVEFRRLTAGTVATSASPAEVAVFAFAPGLRRIWPLKGQAFQVPERDPRTGLPVVTRSTLSAAHARGAVVHVWTVNDREGMERLIELGVDGIITDEIDILKAVLQERDLWEENT